MPICLSSVGNYNDFVLILWIYFILVSFSWHRQVVFSLCCSCFCIIFLDYLLSELFDKQRHLAGNFRGFQRSSLLDILILAVFLPVYTGVPFQYCTLQGNFISVHWQNFCWVIISVLACSSFFFVFSYVCWLIFLFLFQLFRLGHWTVWRGC